MTFAFDVDGTLTAHPAAFGEIMRGLRAQGHKVIVLTGCLSGSPTSPEQRRQQIARLEPAIAKDVHYDSLFVVEAKDTDQVAMGKGNLCKERAVQMLFEDTPQWIPIIRQRSPATACCLVCP